MYQNTPLATASTPRILLSHSTKDNEFVSRLAADLKSAGLDVWVDWLELKVGDSIVENINQRFKETDYLVVVLSPNAVESHWVKAELGVGLMKQLSNHGLTVLPVLYKPADIPALLADRIYADFTQDYQLGLSALLSVFKVDLAEIKQTLPAQSVAFQQQKPCFEVLKLLSQRELRQKIVKRTKRGEVRELWFDVLNYDIDDEFPDHGLTESVFELFVRVSKQERLDQLLTYICESFPDIANVKATSHP